MVCVVFALLTVHPPLFYLKCFGLWYWFALICATELCAALFWRDGNGGGETESEWRAGRQRQGKRESPGEVNGWNARWGSVKELHAGLGGDWRYCVEAAGVTVAVTDTKTTFHGRRHWLKAVARPKPTDHTLSINKQCFLWWIMCDWLWYFF